MGQHVPKRIFIIKKRHLANLTMHLLAEVFILYLNGGLVATVFNILYLVRNIV